MQIFDVQNSHLLKHLEGDTFLFRFHFFDYAHKNINLYKQPRSIDHVGEGWIYQNLVAPSKLRVIARMEETAVF